jgi:hypothetical protein
MNTVEPDYSESGPPSPRENADARQARQHVRRSWACIYAPTYDSDWHNDVLCTNGPKVQRPYLRRGDSYITEAEMRESAREYEDQLNSQ